MSQVRSDAEFERAAQRLKRGTSLQQAIQVLGRGTPVHYREYYTWRIPEGTLEVAFEPVANGRRFISQNYTFFPSPGRASQFERRQYSDRISDGMTLDAAKRLFGGVPIRKETATLYQFTKPSGRPIWARFQDHKFVNVQPQNVLGY